MMMCMCPGMSIIVAMKAERGLIYALFPGRQFFNRAVCLSDKPFERNFLCDDGGG